MKRKVILKRAMSWLLVSAMLMGSVSPSLTVNAKEAGETQLELNDEALKEALAETKEEFPNGAIGFFDTQVNVSEDGKTQLTIVRQGGTDTEATVQFKAVDVSADYGKDYLISITEGKDTSVLAAGENQESLMNKFSDSLTVAGDEAIEKEIEIEPEEESLAETDMEEAVSVNGVAGQEETISENVVAGQEATVSANKAQEAAMAVETEEQDENQVTPEVLESPVMDGTTISLQQLSGLEKAAAVQNGSISEQKSWREVEALDATSEEYAKAEEITSQGEEALKDVLNTMDGVTYTFTFAKGEYKKVVEIEAVDDKLSETDEQILVMLTDATGSELSASNTGYVNIKDNDETEKNVFMMQEKEVSVEQGTEEVTLVVTRTAGVEQMAVMGVGTIEDTAKAGTDYQALTESLVFAPGETQKTVIIPLLYNAEATEDVSFYVGATANNDSIIDANAKVTKVTIDVPTEEEKANRSFEDVSVKDTSNTIPINKQVCYSSDWNKKTWTYGNLDLRNATKIEVSFSSKNGGREWKDGCTKKSDFRRQVKLELVNGNKTKTIYDQNGTSIDTLVQYNGLEGSGFQVNGITLRASVDPTHDNNAADLYISNIKIYYKEFSVVVDNDVVAGVNAYQEKQYTTSNKSTNKGNPIQLMTLKVNGNSSKKISKCNDSLEVIATHTQNQNSAGIKPSSNNITYSIQIYDSKNGEWHDIKASEINSTKLLTNATYRSYGSDGTFKFRVKVTPKKLNLKFKNNAQTTINTSSGKVTKNKSSLGSFNGFSNNKTYTNMTMFDTFVVSAAPKAGFAIQSINVKGAKISENLKDKVSFAPNSTTTEVDINYEDASIEVMGHPVGANTDKGEILYYDSETNTTVSTAIDTNNDGVADKSTGKMTINSITLGKTYNIIGLSKPGYRAVWSDGTPDTNNDGVFSEAEKKEKTVGFNAVDGNVLQYVAQDPYTKIYYDFKVPTIVKDKSKQVALVGKVYLVDEEIFSGDDITEAINGATVTVGESSTTDTDADNYSMLTTTLEKKNRYSNKGDGYFELIGNGSFYTNDRHLVNVNYVAPDGSVMMTSEVLNPGSFQEIELNTQSVMKVDRAQITYYDAKNKVWQDLDYQNVSNSDCTLRMDFDVVSSKTSVQPVKAELKFYSEEGELLKKLTKEVTQENLGQFSFEFNPKEMNIPKGATISLRIYDQNDKAYYERKTGIVVSESLGNINLKNSFGFGGGSTAVKLIGSINSAFDAGWSGNLDATAGDENVKHDKEDKSITINIGFETDDLVNKNYTNNKSLAQLAQEQAEADQNVVDKQRKLDKARNNNATKEEIDKLQKEVDQLTVSANDARTAYTDKADSDRMPNAQKKSTTVAGNVSLDFGVRLSVTFKHDEKNKTHYFDEMILTLEVSGGVGVSVSFSTPIGITIGLGFSITGKGTASLIVKRKDDKESTAKYYMTSVDGSESAKNKDGDVNMFENAKGDKDAFKTYGAFTLAPTITITASAGFGGVVEVSVEGSAEFDMNFYTNDEENNGKVNLSASIGVKVLFISGSWPFVSKDINLFGNSKSSESMDSLNYLHDTSAMLEASDREYLTNRGTWNSGNMSVKALDQNEQGVAEKELLEGIYAGTDVEVVAINESGDYLGVFVDDPGERDALNGAAVYYTIYDHTTGAWAEPVALENDGMIDQDVSVFDLEERGIMVTWSSANKVFKDTDARTSMMNAMDIHAAFFDKGTKSFGEVMNVTKETELVSEDIGCDDVGDVAPSVVYNEDSLLVYYTKNQYAVSNVLEGEVIGDVVYPELSLMAYRQYNFTDATGTNGAWVEDYEGLNDNGAEKEFLISALGQEAYEQYVDAWYGQMFFDTVPNVFIEETLDESGYWAEGTEPTIYKGHTVSDDTTTSDGENGGIVSGSTTVSGNDVAVEYWSPKILDTDAISYSNLGIFAFTGDYDQSLKTTGDRDVYIQLYDFETGAMTHPIILGSNNVEDSQVQFVRAKYTTTKEGSDEEYVYEQTYLTWLSDGNIVALNVSNVIANCLEKKSTEDGIEYYIINKAAGSAYEPVMTLVEGEVPQDREDAISPISSFDVAGNDGYIYVTWTESTMTLKEGVDEASAEATNAENHNIETQVYMARFDFAEGCMTEAVQVTSGAGDNYDNISVVVNKDGTVTAMSTKAGTKVVDAEEFNEIVTDYNENADADAKEDTVAEESFTEYAAIDSENKSLVAMQITPTSVLKVESWNIDYFVAGEENAFSVELLNDGIDTLKDAVVTITDENGNSILQKMIVTSTETEENITTDTVDSITIDKLMGGNRYTVDGKLVLADDAQKGTIKLKVTDKDGNVLVEDIYESAIEEKVAVSNLEVAETEARDVYDVSFNVTNDIYKNSTAKEVEIGITTATGDVKLTTVPLEALMKGETKEYTTTVIVDSAKQFVEGTDEEGAFTETGNFYVKLDDSYDKTTIVRTANDAQLELIESITEGQITDGKGIQLEVGQTEHQLMNIKSSLADEEIERTGTEGLQVLWKVEDESVASVDEFGYLTGNKTGQTTLTAVVLPQDSKTVVSVSEDDEATYNFGTTVSAYPSTPNKAIKTYKTTVTVSAASDNEPGTGGTTTPGTGGTTTPGTGGTTTPGAGGTTTPGTGETTTPDTAKKTATKNKITYSYNTTGKTATITGAKSSVTKLTIPATVKIGGKTYKVTKIANGAFRKCKKLKSVVIGKNVKSIGSKAFYGCKKLKTVTFKGKVAPSIGSKAFKNIHKKATFKVPAKSLKKYKKKLSKKVGVTSSMEIKK